MEVSGLAENKTGKELRSSENTELGFRYTIFVSQSIQRWECCTWKRHKI